MEDLREALKSIREVVDTNTANLSEERRLFHYRVATRYYLSAAIDKLKESSTMSEEEIETARRRVSSAVARLFREEFGALF